MNIKVADSELKPRYRKKEREKICTTEIREKAEEKEREMTGLKFKFKLKNVKETLEVGDLEIGKNLTSRPASVTKVGGDEKVWSAVYLWEQRKPPNLKSVTTTPSTQPKESGTPVVGEGGKLRRDEP